MDNLFALVKAADYDRYMLGLLQPATSRARWMALCAFHAEIAKLPMGVSEPTLGLIRIAWWREALADLQSGDIKKRHEIIAALAVIPDLPFTRMEALLDAYEAEIEHPLAASLEELEQRILRTTHVLHQMLYDGARGQVEEADSLRFGLVVFLKSIYPLARLGKPPFPLDMANPDTFGSPAYLTAAKQYIRQIAAKAANPPAPMGYYLKRAKQAHYNMLQCDMNCRGLGYYLKLLRGSGGGEK